MKKGRIGVPLAAVLLAAGLGAVSCSPQVYYMSLDMRYPSSYGVDLGGKSAAVVYVTDPSGRDSTFNHGLAEGFARGLERDYFHGEQVVDIMTMKKEAGANYASRDTLAGLVMDSGDDVVFLFDATKFGPLSFGSQTTPDLSAAKDSVMVTEVTAPYEVNLYMYDSFSKRDTVRMLVGNSSAKVQVYSPKDATSDQIEKWYYRSLTARGVDTGLRSSRKFQPEWKTESLPLFYYDSGNWDKALQAAYDFKWREAMDIWMKLSLSKNPDKRACAAHNMAVASYILGDLELSTKWLDLAEASSMLSESASLRRRIEKRREALGEAK